MARLLYALSAPTLSRVRRGRPNPVPGTRIFSNVASNWVPSARLPGVMTSDNGRHLPSAARCTLVVSPPRGSDQALRLPPRLRAGRGPPDALSTRHSLTR
ncbi:hypothetical protein GCM10010276_87040 [Streptomyces longisporus]|uniref:Uncharacterized protein n=1 Tax=Streptomyces longisporus TaxID=1948 RepID=A0ABN3NIR3_STRLO